MARPGHTVFTAMPSRTAQYPRAPRPLTPDKLPDISNNVGPFKHFLGPLLHSHKRVFSSASFGAFSIGPNKYGSFVI